MNPFGSRSCGGIHKAAIGKRFFWVTCILKDGHAGQHYNSKRHVYWDELFYWDEIDWNAPLSKVKKPRKKGWATTKDIHTKRGARYDVVQQHKEQEQWKFLEKPESPQYTLAFQSDLQMNTDVEPYYGEW